MSEPDTMLRVRMERLAETVFNQLRAGVSPDIHLMIVQSNLEYLSAVEVRAFMDRFIPDYPGYDDIKGVITQAWLELVRETEKQAESA